MPDIGAVRKYHGPYGADNFISDNPLLDFVRDINDNIIQIDLTTVEGAHLRKTITRNAGGDVTAVSRWSVI